MAETTNEQIERNKPNVETGNKDGKKSQNSKSTPSERKGKELLLD